MIVRPFILAVVLGLLFMAGWHASGTLSSEPDFGDPYSIAIESTLSVVAPRLDTKRLHVTVEHWGGCRRHDFRLHTRVRGDATELWFEHEGNGDECEIRQSMTLHVGVSPRVLETSQVRLLAPDGAMFALR